MTKAVFSSAPASRARLGTIADTDFALAFDYGHEHEQDVGRLSWL